jgi:hypothetical protein
LLVDGLKVRFSSVLIGSPFGSSHCQLVKSLILARERQAVDVQEHQRGDQRRACSHRHQTRLLLSHVLVRSTLIEIALAMVTMLVGGGLFKNSHQPTGFLGSAQEGGAEVGRPRASSVAAGSGRAGRWEAGIGGGTMKSLVRQCRKTEYRI